MNTQMWYELYITMPEVVSTRSRLTSYWNIIRRESCKPTAVLYFQGKKGPDLSTTERFYIRNKAAFDNQLNNKNTVFPNITFDTIYKKQIL